METAQAHATVDIWPCIWTFKPDSFGHGFGPRFLAGPNGAPNQLSGAADETYSKLPLILWLIFRIFAAMISTRKTRHRCLASATSAEDSTSVRHLLKRLSDRHGTLELSPGPKLSCRSCATRLQPRCQHATVESSPTQPRAPYDCRKMQQSIKITFRCVKHTTCSL